MKHADFHIGLEFEGAAGFRWRCTDVGARTIVAVQLTHTDPRLWHGPPYATKEVVFDEYAMESCHIDRAEAIKAALDEARTSGSSGISLRSCDAHAEDPPPESVSE